MSATYSQGALGLLDVEVGGHVAGAEFDRLDVSGTATLGGTLRVATVGGFAPAEGDRFRILEAGQRLGEFASVVAADVGGALAFTAEYDPAGVTLVVSDLSVSIGDAAVAEGDTGRATATFDVTLGTPRSEPVMVQYSTADGTAGAPDDYVNTSG